MNNEEDCLCSGTSIQRIVEMLSINEQLLIIARDIIKEDHQDVLQDIFLELLDTKHPEKIVELCKNNQMQYYLIKIFQNKKNKYKHFDEEQLLNDIEQEQKKDYSIEEKQLIKKIKIYINSLSTFEKNLFFLYHKGGHSIRQLALQLEVPKSTVAESLSKMQKHIKNIPKFLF